MGDQATLDVGPDPRERWAEHEADFTPEPVVRQGLGWLRELYDCRRFLDPCAGAGVFGKVASDLWHSLPTNGLSWALEPRLEEKRVLKRHYHEVDCSTYQEAYRAGFDDEPWDVIATNPPFSEFANLVRGSLPLLAPEGVLMLLGRSAVMQRGAEKVALCLDEPPTYELRIAGAIGFRGPGHNADSWCYSWWIWCEEERRKGRAPRWTTIQLPMLSAADRRWKVRPGTEIHG